MALDANGRPIGKRGSSGEMTYGLNDAGDGYNTSIKESAIQQPVEFQGRRNERIDILAAVSVPAGSDYMSPTVYDFSEYSLIQYGVNTVSTGTGNANILLYSIEGAGFKASLKGGIQSNQNAFQLQTSGVTDLRGVNTLSIGFRNADLQAITASIKAYCQV